MLKHAVIHRSSSSLGGQCSPLTSPSTPRGGIPCCCEPVGESGHATGGDRNNNSTSGDPGQAALVDKVNNLRDVLPRSLDEYHMIEDDLPSPIASTGSEKPPLAPRGGSISLPTASRSCTLPRREPFLKDDLRRSSFRSTGSTCSGFLSSVGSCTSLTPSRSSSTTSLSDTVPVKIYLRRLRSDMEYKTMSLSLRTTCRELVSLLLTKFRLRHRDPKLFFVLMEVTVRAPSDGAPVRRQLVLEDDARPAELQQCRPKGEANFSIGVRRGGLLRVHDAIMNPGSQYKSLMVAYNTTALEVVQLVLKCYNSGEDVRNYALHEVRKNPYVDRPLASTECPLRAQWDWPRANRTNYAFVLRRNLAYAFSLKSRISWRRSFDQSSAEIRTEVEELHEDQKSPKTSENFSLSHKLIPDSRTSSVSSTSSISSTSSSGKSSLDSGYLESPLSHSKLKPKPSTISPLAPTPQSETSPSIPCAADAESEKENVLTQRNSPAKCPPLSLALPLTTSVSKLSLNSSLPNIPSEISVPKLISTPSPLAKELPPKPRKRTVITITSTCWSSSPTTIARGLQRRYIRPVIPPASLKILPATIPLPNGTPLTGGEASKLTTLVDTPSPYNQKTPPSKSPQELHSPSNQKTPPCKAPREVHVVYPPPSAEKQFRDAIEALRSLGKSRLPGKHPRIASMFEPT